MQPCTFTSTRGHGSSAAWKAPPGTLAVRHKPWARTGQLFPELPVCPFESLEGGIQLQIPRLHSSPLGPGALELEPGKVPWVVPKQQSGVCCLNPLGQVTPWSCCSCNGPIQHLPFCLIPRFWPAPWVHCSHLQLAGDQVMPTPPKCVLAKVGRSTCSPPNPGCFLGLESADLLC